MGTDAPTAQIVVRDTRKLAWFWIGCNTLDVYLPEVGPSAWAVYCALCRIAGVSRDAVIPQARLAELTGLSLPTVLKALDTLSSPDYALVRITHRQAENGRSLANEYELLEPILVGPRKEVDVTKSGNGNGAGQSDLWALRPLEAAIAELPTATNRLAVVARLYAMRFDAQTYPFDFARMGMLAKKLSGGATRLCQIIWHANVETVRGNPADYITAVAYKEIKAPSPSARAADDDPQVAFLRKREAADAR